MAANSTRGGVCSILHSQFSILASLHEQPPGRVKFLARTASDL